MNEHQRRLMAAPSVEGGLCCVCGRPAANRHHVVPRSQGGAKGPTVPVCGMGNASGCHGLIHAHRLHLDWRGGWLCLMTPEPTREDEALAMPGWRPLPFGDQGGEGR